MFRKSSSAALKQIKADWAAKIHRKEQAQKPKETK